MNHRIKDLTHQKFNKLTVISLTDQRDSIKEVMWKCICDCGGTKLVARRHLKSGAVKSCGCLTSRKQPKESNLNKLFLDYKGSARQRNYKFDLIKSELAILIKQDCHYCGSPPKSIIRSSSPKISKEWKDMCELTYNGIDRIDNKQGYSIDNVVTCCKDCNMAKRELTKEEFLGMIKMIYERHINVKS